MFCTKCGKQNADGARFCVACGASMVPPVRPVTPDKKPEQPATPANEPVQKGEPSMHPAQPKAAPIHQAGAPAQPQPKAAPIHQAGAPVQPQPKVGPIHQAEAPARKKKSVFPVVLSIFLILMLVLGIGAGVYFLSDSSENTKKKQTEKPYDEKKPTATGKPTEALLTTTPAVTKPLEQEETFRTIMIYMIGSNLESEGGLASQDIEEMLLAEESEKVKIVLQTGGTLKWHLGEIEDGKVQRFEIENHSLKELDNLGAVSMVETRTLTDFIRFSKEKYPAKEYTLILWNHGGSVPIGFGSDELHEGELTDVEIGQAINDADIHIDALVFNACEMCSLELFMSIKDCVDYVVAAESVVYGYKIYGSGIDYTSWINLAIKEDVSAQTYCEKILDDYMAFLERIKSPGSMSVIRMDQIEEVYSAYVDYIGGVYKDLKNGGYAKYVQARENCGTYEGTDSVDISTLATKYENEYSNALRNAVTNAVIRTKSGISYCHGITAYSPYQYAQLYTKGRKSFEVLGYDSEVVEFYDLLSSKILYYNDMLAYAGDWYIKQSDEKEHGKENALNYTDKGDHVVIALSPADWDIIKNVKIYYSKKTATGTYYYGSDVRYSLDSNNRDIYVKKPDTWLAVNGYFATSLCQVFEADEDGWYKVVFVYCYVNGKEAFLRVDSSSESDGCTIVGYYLADFESGKYDNGHKFVAGDKVKLAASLSSDGKMKYLSTNEEFEGSELSAEFCIVNVKDDERAIVRYRIEDVYGNSYNTEWVYVD